MAQKNNPPPAAWEKQDTDSPKSFAAFCAYRNLGPTRSLRKTVLDLFPEINTAKIPAKHRQFQRWSSGHNWVARCEAWDAEQDRLLELETAQERKKMAKRHASQALLHQSKSLERIKDLDPTTLSPMDALRMWTESVRIERLSLGAPDHHTQHSGEIKPIARWIDDIEDIEEENDGSPQTEPATGTEN